MTDPMLQFFTYDHLPESLQTVSRPFCELAYLRKLLEAKDCAVRAFLYQDPPSAA